jgi:hypothetical protein
MLFQHEGDLTSSSSSGVSTAARRVSRSLIITPTRLLLCDENLALKNVSLTLIDELPLKDIIHLKYAAEKPCSLAIIFKASRMFSKKQSWELTTETANAMTKLVKSLQETCGLVGNTIKVVW